MPSPGASSAPRLPMDHAYLELLADTLESMDIPARSQFLQRYFRTTTQLDLRESQSLQLWEEMLTRRRELSAQLRRPISLAAVLVDVLSTAGLIRVPVMLEYGEFRTLQVNAVTDPLTGLYNRRLFAESFEKELNRARRYGLPLSILILDLRRFKDVNDKYGHPRGDDVLRAVAGTLQKTMRTSDSAFRIGGDEFALLLPQTDAPQALALSRRIGSVFAESLESLHLAISVIIDHGLATFPHDGDQSELLIRVADERLYRLKHAGHSRTAPDHEAQAGTIPSPTASSPATPPAPIPIASGRPDKPVSESPIVSSDAAHPLIGQPASRGASPTSYTVQRKAERVSMLGTNAYAVIGEQGDRRARVLDLGFGGVALELEEVEELPESLTAILHVPILPPVRVFLKTVWAHRTSGGAFRLGCHFIS